MVPVFARLSMQARWKNESKRSEELFQQENGGFALNESQSGYSMYQTILLIGGGAGAAGGMLVSASMCSNDSECSAIAGAIFVPAGLGIGMAAGALIDSSITKYDTVFENGTTSAKLRLQVSPVISHEQKGVSVSFAF